MSDPNKDAQPQIRGLVDEIVRLSKLDCSPEVFFAGFLSRTAAALAAHAGAIWVPGEHGWLVRWLPVCRPGSLIPNSQEHLDDRRRLAQDVFVNGKGALIKPRFADPIQGTNATDYLLMLCPVLVKREVKLVVEILQRPNPSDKTQRGYLRFLEQMCCLAGDYLKRQ